MKTGLALMPEEDFKVATRALFEEGQVDVLEWSFDVHWGGEPLPEWCSELVDQYSERGRLLGHGVTFSPFSGGFSVRQTEWLNNLSTECDTTNYVHISEHFGFMETDTFLEGAPMPLPLMQESLDLGRRCLGAISMAANLPVGLENLALAFGLEDVKRQGDFLYQVLSTVDGFLLLDLHNLFCQSVNFSISMDDLLLSYPLELVKEIHISGGSWSERKSDPDKLIRRDTHDDDVPKEVFESLASTLPRCRNLEYVILERLGNTIEQTSQKESFARDYKHLLEIVNAAGI